MTDPDQPFQRAPGPYPPDNNQPVATEPTNGSSEAPDGQPILDPELHQSVWKPWQDPVGGSRDNRTHSTPTDHRPRGRRARLIILLAALGATLVLVAAMVVPQLDQTPTWRVQPLVVDFATQPEIAWSSPFGEPCSQPLDGDYAILSDSQRVWSLDLTNGETTWSVDMDGFDNVTCLPEADMVAVTRTGADGGATVVGTTLLSASSGTEVGHLPADSVTAVVPLGPNIGLVDATNMLTAFSPADLDLPLWSRQLQGEPGRFYLTLGRHVDDDIIQIVYPSDSAPEGNPRFFRLTVATADGTSPPWASGPAVGLTHYQRFGDVIIQKQYNHQDDVSAFNVVDLEGRELWDPGADQLGSAGSSLYRAWPSSSDPLTGYTNLHRVDPSSGASINKHSYQGWFDYTVTAKDNIAVLRGGTLYILDKRLQERPEMTVEGFHTIHEGNKWVYTWSARRQNGESRGLLSAIDTDGERVVWTMDLDHGQYVGQLSRHLVVVDDDDETIHGLKSSS